MKYKQALSIITLLIISCFDWITGVTLSYSFLYFLPLMYIAMQGQCRVMHLVVNALVALALWNFIYIMHVTSIGGADLIINSILRLSLYLFIPYLVMINKRQKSELEIINKKLKQLNVEKNKFLGIAAHDILSIASAINGFSSLIQIEKNSEKTKKYGTIISESSERLIHLVTYLLDFSKIESGTINLKIKAASYIEFIKSRIELFSIIAEKKNITISLTYSSEKITLEFDQTYLSEVIDNLLSNAIKYSQPNTEIKVNVILLNDSVLTEVIDNGVGIKDYEIAGIFEPFKKTSNQPTGKEKSTGLGLSIAKKIVTLHGGSINVTSQVGKGSTFYYNLPLKYLKQENIINADGD